jgi:nucleotide-binding universal stress UspA family protein
MATIRTILHPTALVPASREAARLAGLLAKEHGARLVVLHVMRPWSRLSRAELLGPHFRQKGEKWAALRGYDLGVAGLPRELRLIEGEPVTTILRMASELPADLIVMSRGEWSRLRWWHGERIADAVTRLAPCPVLIAATPAGAPEHELPDRLDVDRLGNPASV